MSGLLMTVVTSPNWDVSNPQIGHDNGFAQKNHLHHFGMLCTHHNKQKGKGKEKKELYPYVYEW
jgi:hypothetical protein